MVNLFFIVQKNEIRKINNFILYQNNDNFHYKKHK